MRSAVPLAERTSTALALIAVLGVMYALVARLALDAFPFAGDEYSLVLQSRLFADGAMSAPMPPHAEWLGVDHVVMDTAVRSKYPPGAAALLAVGERAGVVWLVTPFEAVVALVAAWWAFRRVLGARAAFVGLVALGVAPLFSFQAATFFPHTAAVMFLALAFAGVVAGRTMGLVAAGAAIGAAFLVRPTDAVFFGVALLAFRSLRVIAIVAAAALPFAIANLVYQGVQWGAPLADGYHAYEPAFRALYGDSAAHPISFAHLVSGVQQWNHLDICRAFIIEWSVPGAVLVALTGAYAIDRGHPARVVRDFCIALIAILVGCLLFMIGDPDDGARPRYLSIAVLPCAFLVAAGFDTASRAVAARFGARVRTVLVVLAVVFSLGRLAAILQEHIPKVWAREGLYTAVADSGIEDAVVIVRAQYPSRFARNGPYFDGRVLYLSVPREIDSAIVTAAYPTRPVWEAFEGEPTWKVVRVR